MATKKDFQIDRRVAIAMDAMTSRQKAALEPVLRSKDRFVAHANGPGRSKKLSGMNSIYQMRVGQGLRVFYTIVDGNIFVLDVMRKVAMDRLSTMRKGRQPAAKKDLGRAAAEEDRAMEPQKG